MQPFTFLTYLVKRLANGVYTEVNAAIIERCKQGERKAFHELYCLYAKPMFGVAARIVNNHSEAEEVLQDSFLKAFERISTFKPGYSFGAWLKKIVVNGALDVLRKRKVKFVSLDGIQNEQQYELESEELYYDVETIIACVAALPDGYRTVLSLYLFENYSHSEIAEFMGISEGTSKSQYARAKSRLVELLKQKTVSNER